MFKLSVIKTAWGFLGMATTERGICGLTLPEAAAPAAMSAITTDFPEGQVMATPGVQAAVEQIQSFFLGRPIRFVIQLDLPEKPVFWRRVWEVVAAIPYGMTKSYGAVAEEAGASGAARAVGQAMAHNPVPIVIPCHRVLGSDGKLTGFGGGLDMKQRLLIMEQRSVSCHP